VIDYNLKEKPAKYGHFKTPNNYAGLQSQIFGFVPQQQNPNFCTVKNPARPGKVLPNPSSGVKT